MTDAYFVPNHIILLAPCYAAQPALIMYSTGTSPFLKTPPTPVNYLPEQPQISELHIALEREREVIVTRLCNLTCAVEPVCVRN
jgi:hypothetical protein